MTKSKLLEKRIAKECYNELMLGKAFFIEEIDKNGSSKVTINKKRIKKSNV